MDRMYKKKESFFTSEMLHNLRSERRSEQCEYKEEYNYLLIL